MNSVWYPQDKEELNKVLENYLSKKSETRKDKKEIHGLIVPHAGYEFSGEIAGKTFSFLTREPRQKAIILSPSHYLAIGGAYTHNENIWETPLGKIKIFDMGLPKINIKAEHAIGNQIPFLQKLGFEEIAPILTGDVSINEAKNIAKHLSSFNDLFIISTDLSHFLPYEEAAEKDEKTIGLIENLDTRGLLKEDNCACGIFPLIILMELCKIKRWKPELIMYKNSGDITGIKDSVIGYAGMIF